MRDNRHRLGERQRQFVFRHAADGLREFIAERDRQRHRAAVAAGPAIGVGAELVDARQEVRGHADIAVPDVVERDLADLRPQPLQPLRHARLDPLHLVAGADHRAAGDEAVSCVVAREIEFAMGIRHRLPAGDDGLADVVGQWLRRHLPGQHRHHLARDVGHQRFREFAAIGVGRHDQRAAGNLALGGLDHPAVVAALKTFGRRARVDARAETEHGAREAAGQRQRIDVAAGLVPEAAEPRIRARHVPRLLARQQLDRCAEFRPLPHATLGDLDAAGRMHRLNPTGLFPLGVDVVAPCHVEQIGSAVAQHADKTFSRLAVLRNNVLRIGPRQRRDDLAVVAPRSAPARLRGLDDRDIDACFAQMQRGRKTGETATDHDHVRLLRAGQFGQFRPRWRHRRPQGLGPADVTRIHRYPFLQATDRSA